MEITIKEQPFPRRNAIILLQKALLKKYPVLLIGESGTGKSFWIKQLSQTMKKENNHSLPVIETDASIVTPEKWKELMIQAHLGTLLINNIELLNKNTQTEITKFIEKIIENNNTKYSFRLVLSSTIPIKKLKDTTNFIPGFFNKISIQTIIFPNFAQCYEKNEDFIEKDFKIIWKKLHKNNNPPFAAIFLLKRTYKNLKNNFWDLYRIANLWQTYREMKISDIEILMNFKKLISPESELIFTLTEQEKTAEDIYLFKITKGEKYENILKRFRNELKMWSRQVYGSYEEAAKALGISPRSMERW